MTAESASEDLPPLAMSRVGLIVAPVIIAKVYVNEKHYYKKGAVHIELKNNFGAF